MPILAYLLLYIGVLSGFDRNNCNSTHKCMILKEKDRYKERTGHRTNCHNCTASLLTNHINASSGTATTRV